MSGYGGQAMPVIKLSEAGVGRLEPPGQGRVDYWDKTQSGFGLRLTSSGKRTWQIMYRSGGVRRRLALGEWPALPLKLARQAAEQAMAQVAAGKDPARERAVVTGGPVTVQRLADAYLERHAKRNKKTWAADAGMIRREVLPAWGKRSADTIRRRDVSSSR